MYDISQLNQMMRHSRILADITGREMSDYKDAYGPQIADGTEENEELGDIQSNIVQETNTLPHTIDESDAMPKDKEYSLFFELKKWHTYRKLFSNALQVTQVDIGDFNRTQFTELNLVRNSKTSCRYAVRTNSTLKKEHG